MKILQLLIRKKRRVMPLLCLVALLFVYGCKCEGSIGSAADAAGALKNTSSLNLNNK